MKPAASVLLLLMLAACGGDRLTPHYASPDVRPVTVERIGPDEVAMRFLVPPESLYFASGVNYEIDGDSMRVVIDRCGIRKACHTMVRRDAPLPASRVAEVSIPFRGNRVIVIHGDREESFDLRGKRATTRRQEQAFFFR